MRLSSYTRVYAQTNSYSYQLLDTNGVLVAGWGNAWNSAQNVNWSLAQGGTDTATMGWSYLWSDGGYFGFGQGAPNPWTWDSTSTTGIKWPAAPGLGTQTNRYDWASWAYDYDLASYYLARSYSTNGSDGVAQPTYPWVHVAVSSRQTSAGETSTPNYRTPWTNALTETAQAHIELLTGGEPGASNVMFYSLWVYVGDSSGSGVSPGDLVVAGQTADASGRVVLALPANASQDITPALPASYTNYSFWVGGPWVWNYAVWSVTPDDWSPSVSSNVTFTAQMNDIGPVPPVIEWRVNGVVDTNSTSTSLTRAFTNAGTYTVTAQCINPGADTNAPEATVTTVFRGVIALTAGAVDIAVGSGVTFTASTTPAIPATNLTWIGQQSWQVIPPAANAVLLPADLNGGLTKTFYFDVPDYGPDSPGQPVTVQCGDSSASQNVRVYAIAEVRAATNVVAVGSNVQFTATLTRAGPSPPAIEWYVNGARDTNFSGTNLTCLVTNTGAWLVMAKCGTSSNSAAVTGFFAGAISLAVSAEDIAVGSNVTFTATLTPAVTPNSVSWSGSSGTMLLLDVFSFPYIAAFPDAAAGLLSCSVTFDTPGEKNVTNICDVSSAGKTIRVFAVTGVAAGAPAVALGQSVTLTATVDPTNCPLPLTWTFGNSNLTSVGTTVTFTPAVPGDCPISVSLGSSVVTSVVAVVNVVISERTNYACAGSSVGATYTLTNSFGPVIWSITPSATATATIAPVDAAGASALALPGSVDLTYTVTATSALLTNVSDSATLVVFAVSSPLLVRHPDGGPFTNAPGNLNVLYQQSAFFQATNSVARAFPPDEPFWFYPDPENGPGVSKTIQFNTYSGDDNRFTLVAQTGFASANHGILVGRYVMGIHTRDPSSSSSGGNDGSSSLGHAWISLTDRLLGARTTYGLWPDTSTYVVNNGPDSDVRIDLPRDTQSDQDPEGIPQSRYYFLRPSQYQSFLAFVGTSVTWTYYKNCAWWANQCVQAVGLPAPGSGAWPLPTSLGNNIASEEAGLESNPERPVGSSFRTHLQIIQGQ